MLITQEEYDTLGEAEYMIDDILILATPITYGNFCDANEFISNRYSLDAEGYDVVFCYTEHIFMPRYLFETISSKSEY
jgi:hypothetical protein